LTITGIDGHRITAFATNTTRGPLADLEVWHHLRARWTGSTSPRTPG
jgi:hypothetical protein